jgi:hypothetical protein
VGLDEASTSSPDIEEESIMQTLDWNTYREQLVAGVGGLATLISSRATPPCRAGQKAGHLDEKSDELIALAAAITLRCSSASVTNYCWQGYLIWQCWKAAGSRTARRHFRYSAHYKLITSAVGTFETCRDVRSSVAIGGIADMARTARFGRD